MNKHNSYASRLLTEAERFWIKVNKDGPVPEHRPDLGPCWLWLGSCQRDGYGQFAVGSRKDDSRRLVLAHRWAFHEAYGYWPEEGDHLCHNRPCVRPNHIEDVSHAENVQRGDHAISGHFQRVKTHCPKGHEYTPENTYISTLRRNGHVYHPRVCRECRRLYQPPIPTELFQSTL